MDADRREGRNGVVSDRMATMVMLAVALALSPSRSARIPNSKSAHVFRMRQRRMDRRAEREKRVNGTDERGERKKEEGRGRRAQREGTRPPQPPPPAGCC